MELPIPWAGTVTGIHVAVGDEVEVGTVIITIDDGAEGQPLPTARPLPSLRRPTPLRTALTRSRSRPLVGYGPKASGTTRRAAGPPLRQRRQLRQLRPRRLLRQRRRRQSVALTRRRRRGAPAVAAETRALAKPPVKTRQDPGIDLGAVPPTGERGIVTRADVESYAAGRANPRSVCSCATHEACDMPQEAQLQTARAGMGRAADVGVGRWR